MNCGYECLHNMYYNIMMSFMKVSVLLTFSILSYSVIFVLGGSTAMLVCVLLLMVAVVIPCFVVKLRKSPSLAKKSSLDGKPSLGCTCVPASP